MADVITALAQKRSALIRRKDEIKRDADRKIAAIDEELEHIQRALKTLDDAVRDYLCPSCKGTGTARRADAAGQMEDYPCPDCKGTGVV